MEYDSDETLNSLLHELDAVKIEPTGEKRTDAIIPPSNLKADNLEKYILDSGADTVRTTQSIIQILLDQIQVNPDPELITSVAEMVNSNNRALETITKIHLNNVKLQQAKELEQFKQSVKLKIADDKLNANRQRTREEVMKDIIDAEVIN